MKNIMFNDHFGLTQAVLEGRKTQTRRSFTLALHNEPSDVHSDQREGCWVVCPTCKKFIDVDGKW